jgi:tRNA(fMet)-specific endonuclease VapC
MNAPAVLQSVVCDTDAASFAVKDDPIRGPRYLRHLEERIVIMPFCVLAELRLGAEVRNWGSGRRARMEQFIQSCRVYHPNDRVCALWASTVAALRRAGRQISPHDAWIAVTALYLGAPLVTHNAQHYLGIPDLQILTEPDV